MRLGPWTRVGTSPREVPVRMVMSTLALVPGIAAFVGLAQTSHGSWTKLIWPSLYLFVAWRFLGLGVHVSHWGVRIKNPVLTYWFPWRNVAGFELDSTGEAFARTAKGVVVVPKSGRRRLAWALTTSRRLPSSISDESLEEILAWLNAQIPVAVGRST